MKITVLVERVVNEEIEIEVADFDHLEELAKNDKLFEEIDLQMSQNYDLKWSETCGDLIAVEVEADGKFYSLEDGVLTFRCDAQ